MQHKPRFSGIIIAAVLMVAALVMISSYSSLFASSKSTMMLSEAMGYFESNQVTYFNLDLNTGVIEMSVKEGEHPLPESGTSSGHYLQAAISFLFPAILPQGLYRPV